MEKNGQTVRVVDEQGTVIGYTYPKRAKGLVKKCRAEFVSDQEIRLYKQSPTYENMEDEEMDAMNIENRDNFITVNPREWRKNPETVDTIWDRFFISNPLAGEVPSAGSMEEILSVGTFEWQEKSRITNGCQELQPNTEYHLVFWLNGGENDRSDETCQLQILFTNESVTASVAEFEKGMCFRLNRGFIKPLKKYKGWEYYDITFTTTDARYTQFQFVADRAPMALMPAEKPDAYASLEEVLDPFEGKRPQRHNIVFEDGWPSGKWYSTERLSHMRQGEDASLLSQDEWFRKLLQEEEIELEDSLSEMLDSIRDEILDSLDVDGMRDEIIESVSKSMNKDSSI